MPHQVDIVSEESSTDDHENSLVKRQVAISCLSFLPGALIEGAYLFLHLFMPLILPSFFIAIFAPVIMGTVLSIAALLADMRGRLWLYRQRVGIEHGWHSKVLINPQIYEASVTPLNFTNGTHLQEYVNAQIQCYVLLGAAGSGKTKALFYLIQSELENYLTDMSSNRRAIPVFVSLKDYSDFLKTNYPLNNASSAEDIQPGTLYKYLLESKIKSLRYLRPLIDVKQIWFLFDGLNEIDEQYQDSICAELIEYMEWSKNAIITCREIDYHENPLFAQLSSHANLIIMKPLEEQEQDALIRSYIEKGFVDEHGKRWRSTSEQIIDFIKEKQLRSECSNPQILFMLMQTIDAIGTTSEINTLGKLLRESVYRRIDAQQPEWQELIFHKEDLIYYIGEIACAMRRVKCVSGLSLHPPSTVHYEQRYLAWAEELNVFIKEPSAKNARSITRASMPETHAFTLLQQEQMLRFAAEAGLLSISANGILNFDYKSMAEYFVAEFLRVSDTGVHLPYEDELINTEGYWNEPIHIWAGLLDDPMLLAHRFGELGITCKDEEDDRSYNALTSGLMCLGVHWIHSFQSYGEQNLPDSLYDLFKSSLENEGRRNHIAAIFERCAQEGSDAVYRPLLKLLTVNGAEKLLLTLPRSSIQSLLFEYLERIAEMPIYRKDVEALEHILGNMNDNTTFQWALAQSEPALLQPPERSVHLRQAAISILGTMRRKEAIGNLLAYLSETDVIKEKAIEALCQMKLDDVIRPLLSNLIVAITPTIERRQLAILRIVGTFLESAGPIGHREIVQQLLHVLSSPYQPLHGNVKMLLKEEATSGHHDEEVRKNLVAAFTSPDADSITISNIREILIYIGDKATGILLEYVNQPGTKVSDTVKIRIIEVLGKTRNHSALSTLYTLVAYDNGQLRREVALALRNYQSEIVVPMLVDKVLYKSDKEAYAAIDALKIYGANSVEFISVHLVDHALPARINSLIRLLQIFQDRKSISALNALLNTKPVPEVAIELIKTLKLFRHSVDTESVSVLLKVLTTRYEEKAVYNAASETLSSYGEQVLPALLSELENAQPKGSRGGIMNAISRMQPFPYKPLLNAFKTYHETQIKLIRALFVGREKEGASFLVKYLCHSESSIQRNVRITIDELGKKNTNIIIEPLLDQLSESICRNVVIQYLRNYADTAIPLLALRLGDEHSGKIAYETLVEMSPLVIDRLPALIPALNKPQDSAALRYARLVLLGIVDKQQQLPPQVIDLFRDLTDSSVPAHDVLVQILSGPLIQSSISPLLQSLSSQHLSVQQGVRKALIKIGRDDTTTQSKVVIDGLIAALSEEEKRPQAEQALKGIGKNAVNSIFALIMDHNHAVRKSARDIMSDMGALAFELLFHALEDAQPERRDAAEAIITNMEPEAIKDSLIQFLASNDVKQIEQGLILLFGRVRAEANAPTGHKKMLTILLEHIQIHPINQQTLPVIAFLLSLPDRQEMLDALVELLDKQPQTQKWLSPLFLLLALEGSKTRDSLLRMIQKGNMSRTRYKEIISILGILEPHQYVIDLAQSIGKHAQSFSNMSDIQQIYEVELSRHALGSLLLGGHWNTNQLLKLKKSAIDGSAQHELFSVLLGDSYLPRIETLQKDLDNEKVMRAHEAQGQQSIIVTQREEINRLQAQIAQKNNVLQRDSDDLLEARTSLMEKDGRILQITLERDAAQQNEARLQAEIANAHIEVANTRNKYTLIYQELQEAISQSKRLEEEVARLKYSSGSY
jgi:HEAT repeat protein